ncbi:MAG: hypothetical protein SFU27_11515, partial [Thermonemataceae bacterium]|nr:hypothetical protein [Thermonemataceae bacterium]
MSSKIVTFSYLRIALLVAYLLPIVLLLWFVSSFSIDVPLADEWILVNLFDKVVAGRANFVDFFAQHNEHRIFFPKIIFTVLAFASKWNIQYEIYFGVFLIIVNFFLIYKISSIQSNTEEGRKFFHLVNFITCILVFSLVQYENLLWGFASIPWSLVNTFLLLSILMTVFKEWLPSCRLLLSAIFCFMASFSLANGLLSWIALIPSVFSIQTSKISRLTRLLLWLLVFALSLAIYSFGYSKPNSQTDLFFFVKHPLTTGFYFLTLLGSPIAGQPLSLVIGLFVLSIFLFFSIYCLKNYKSYFTQDAAPWLSMGLYSLMSAALTTVGRAELGVEQATTSRYTTASMLVIVATVHLWRLLLYHRKGHVYPSPRVSSLEEVKVERRLRSPGNIHRSVSNLFVVLVTLLFTGLLICCFFLTSANAIEQGKKSLLYRKNGKTCVELIYFLDESGNEYNCFWGVGTFSMVKAQANTLARIGFKTFPKTLVFNTTPNKGHGHLDTPSTTGMSLVANKTETITASGWAIFPDKQE